MTAEPTSPSMAPSPRILSRLSQLSTCDISDALLKLGVPSGGFVPDLQAFSLPSLPASATPSSQSSPPLPPSPPIIGPAYTVQLAPFSSTAPKPSEHFVDAIPQGGAFIVICAPVVNQDSTGGGAIRNSCWGGLMTLGAKGRGAKGVVIVGGGVRDLREHREEGFPVFASYHSTLPQAPFTRPSSLQVPLSIPLPHLAYASPLVIHPGDYIMADEDGVVCIPSASTSDWDWQKLVCEAEKRAAVDALCAKDLKEGKGVAETFKARRE